MSEYSVITDNISSFDDLLLQTNRRPLRHSRSVYLKKRRPIACNIIAFTAMIVILQNVFVLQTSTEHITSAYEAIAPVASNSIKPAKFDRFPVSTRTYHQVRTRWTHNTEIPRPLELIQLPNHFQGDYKPKSLSDFVNLAAALVDDQLGSKPKNSTIGIVSICIGLEYCSLSTPNHQIYASKHGYDYLIIDEDIPGVQPKKLKFLVLAWGLSRGYDWLLMLDADALLTNHAISIPSLLETFKPSKDTNLIMTRGGNWKNLFALNNGVFLLRNSEWSLQHLYEIFTTRWSFTKFLGKSLVDQPIQTSLLLAEKEIQWPPKKEQERGVHLLVVEKRRLNSFYRDSLYASLDKTEGGQWQEGDFVAHFASRNKYSLMIDIMQKLGMAVPPARERFPFPLPFPGQDTPSGTCWCSNKNKKASLSSLGETAVTPLMSCIPKYHLIGVHKAGTKAVMQYLGQHSQLLGPFIEDPASWLTDTYTNDVTTKCDKKRKLNDLSIDNNREKPIYLFKKKSERAIRTCSFEDYSLLYGETLVTDSSDLTINHDSCMDLERSLNNQKTLFDEMVIWDQTFSSVRGVPLPDLFKLIQPSAQLIITVRSSPAVVYSAYHHFGDFGEVEKGPQHFHSLVQELTSVWEERQCTPSNHKTCLPPHLVRAGGWFSRAAFSAHLREWLSRFDCSQVFIFDVSEELTLEVQRLFQFMGVNDNVARNVTNAVSNLINAETAKTATESDKKSIRRKNVMNKAYYDPMLKPSKDRLDDFFAPYYYELCSLIVTYPCMDLKLFRDMCAGSRESASLLGVGLKNLNIIKLDDNPSAALEVTSLHNGKTSFRP